MGTLAYLKELFPPEAKFSINDIPDLTGKVIIVTGANSGIGKETARALLLHNAKVYIAARNRENAEIAIQELEAETGKDAVFLELDLANLQSVKRAAAEFLSKENDLHVLFNNAGVMIPPVEDTTTDGYDLQFGTNVLGHFYLTKLLLPALQNGTKSSGDGTARVIFTSSSASMLSGPIDFNTLKDGPARRRKATTFLYFQSKLGNVCIANEFAKRYGDQGIVTTSLNPGNLVSYLKRSTGWLERAIFSLLLYPTPLGALTQLWVGTTAEGASMNGKYLKPWARYGKPNPLAEDPQLTADLWKWCEEQVANF